jgi:hypothetical protein
MRVLAVTAATTIALSIAVASSPPSAHAAAAPEAAQETTPPTGDSAATDAAANNGGDEAGDLAKQVQNPIANLISVPFQNNLDYNIGPYERARSTLNIQPVIPVKLTPEMMLITRTIVPIMYQPDVSNTGGGSSGLGDINPAFFFSSIDHGPLMWGMGPTFLLPTATQRATGSGKWSVGVTAVGLLQPGKWTIGVLASNLWSVSGPDDRVPVNQMTVQYFLNYNLPKAWYLTSAPILTANWQAEANDVWTIPFGAGVGRVFKLGKLPLNGSLSMYRNAVRPDSLPSAAWQLRVQIALLFPTGKRPTEKPSSEVAAARRR